MKKLQKLQNENCIFAEKLAKTFFLINKFFEKLQKRFRSFLYAQQHEYTQIRYFVIFAIPSRFQKSPSAISFNAAALDPVFERTNGRESDTSAYT